MRFEWDEEKAEANYSMKTHSNHSQARRGRTDWKKVASLSDEEVTRRARSDPDARPLTPRQLAAMRRVPQVKRLRLRLNLSQDDFARTFHLSVSTLRDWEQGRSEPDQPSRTLLQLIETIPEEVKAALEEYARRSVSA